MVHPLIVIGSEGFIGRHFCRHYPGALAITRKECDLNAPEVNFPTEGRRYALIAAGVSSPKECEEDPEGSYRCNVEGSLKLGKALLKRAVLPIFLSSDYVYNDQLAIAPQTTYGGQKAELEERSKHLEVLILRLSKVYGLEKGDGTLFDAMAAQLVRGETLLASYDQIFSPLFIGDLIEQAASYIKMGTRGIFSCSGPNWASRYEMAKELAKSLGVKESLVRAISLDELNDGIRRPKNLKLRSNLPALSWQEGIKQLAHSYAK